MNPKEQGFLLLTGTLGDSDRRPLSAVQLRTLAKRIRSMDPPETGRHMQAQDLIAIGYAKDEAERIVQLMSHTEQMKRYVQQAAAADCYPVTRISDGYPQTLRYRLGIDAPACLWAKGAVDLLCRPAVALVGSRDLRPENQNFAYEAGKQAALQGIVLVSGNARGADRTAQDACLEHGGSVISVVADELARCPLRRNVLYLSEYGWDVPFSAHRALSRNRVIQTLGYLTLIAQCDLGTGGTWDGTTKNLHHGWSPVFCFDDGSRSVQQLMQMGATGINIQQLENYSSLQPEIMNFIGQ